MTTQYVIIKGKVQGVFFRASAKKTAVRLKITGWVRNTNTGNVELVAQGEAGNVEEFISWCRKGPEDARVESVTIEHAEKQDFSTFQILQ